MAAPRVSSGFQADIPIATELRSISGEDQNVQLVNVSGMLAWQATRQTVGLTAVQLAATPLALRKSIAVKALAANSGQVYVGAANTVTTATGYELSAGDAVTIDLDAVATVWAIADTVAQAVAVIEAA